MLIKCINESQQVKKVRSNRFEAMRKDFVIGDEIREENFSQTLPHAGRV